MSSFAKNPEFKWESVEQQKGFGNLTEWLNKRGYNYQLTPELFLIACYFIQKDHEAQEWFIQVIGNRISELQLEILKLRSDLEKTGAYNGKEETSWKMQTESDSPESKST